MAIGIIVAMDKELQLLLPLLDGLKNIEYKGYTFHAGEINGKEAVVGKCGIGKVNAALGAQAMIEACSPSLLINTGVAGGAGGGAGILDVVVGERVAYHDVWCGPGTEWGEAAGCPRFFESDRNALSLPSLSERQGVKRGLVCSGDIFVDSPAVVAAIKANYPDALAVDMESAAIAQTCYKNSVPFLCLRVLSDTPGDNENNIAQYENFWDDAPARTFSILRQVIAEL